MRSKISSMRKSKTHTRVSMKNISLQIRKHFNSFGVEKTYRQLLIILYRQRVNNCWRTIIQPYLHLERHPNKQILSIWVLCHQLQSQNQIHFMQANSRPWGKKSKIFKVERYKNKLRSVVKAGALKVAAEVLHKPSKIHLCVSTIKINRSKIFLKQWLLVPSRVHNQGGKI